ncbi:MAG TPA: MFS transporter [Thermoleophilaceae bacterium]|nr:MFS transporter [Thermoleophilaceae bacterium]
MTTRDDDGRLHPNITLGVLATAAVAYAVSQTMVVPALPEIQRELGVSQTQVTWVLTIYLLTASIATPIVGRLGDIYGKARMLSVTLVLFAVGLMVAALSHSLELLVAGRAIQGCGGAVFPLAFGIIRDEFPREKVGTAIGLISATFGIGGGAGLVLSGLIVDHMAYEWIFWLAFAVVVGSLAATRIWVPESPVRAPSRIDWGGAALLSAGLVLVLLALSEGNAWGCGSARIVALLVAGTAVLAVWGWFETRVDDPLVDMRMMRRRPVWTTNLTGFLVGFGMFGSFILTPQLVETPAIAGYGFGATVTEAGLFMLPSTAAMLVAGPLSGWLGTKVGFRVPVLLGTAAAALSFLWLALLHDEPWQIVFGVALLGVGIGLSFAAMANLIVEAVEPTETGIATGMNTIMRTLGGSLGGQIAASIVAAQVVAGTSFPAESGFTWAFAMSAVGLALAFGAALAIPRVRRRARVPVPA